MAILEIYDCYVLNSPATFELAPVGVRDRAAWFEQHSGGGRYRLVVATDEGRQMLRWATTSSFHTREANDTTVEASVNVRPGSVGTGLGSRLYRDLFQSIQTQDIERIAAGITQPNPASVRLTRATHFVSWGPFRARGRMFHHD